MKRSHEPLEGYELQQQAKKARTQKEALSNLQTYNEIGLDESEAAGIEDLDVDTIGERDVDEQESIQWQLETGVPLEALNMNEEIRKQEIDEVGMYKFRRERDEDVSVDEEDEAWLLEYEEKIKENPSLQYKKVKIIENLFNEEEGPEYDTFTGLNKIAELLLWGENVRSAVKRIKASDKKEDFESILQLSADLIANGMNDLYQYTKDDLYDKIDTLKKQQQLKQLEEDDDDMFAVPKQSKIAATTEPKPDTYELQYEKGGETHNDLSHADISSWIKEKYFKGEEYVKLITESEWLQLKDHPMFAAYYD
eukprot:TRINITY_DN5562_c0_g1_i2.p1 TRINITY_DN5562_c0_g1~~TRINITY_DN5562_c0_g1_i2.p1  ORF type:complete len:309 (-),score=92.88 TRINITY_DN5562_c0_g1_i2:519-1445(-)